MQKILKLSATARGPEFTHVAVSVATQTHRGNEFGANGQNNFKASNGVMLQSRVCPDYRGRCLFVRGKSNDRDNDVINIPILEWPLVKAAVEEYNKINAEVVKPVVKKRQHLKISGEGCGDKIKITVLVQTHFYKEFGNNKTCFAGEFIHGKIRLASSLGDSVRFVGFVPDEHKNKGLAGTFYLSDGRIGNNTCEVTVAQWNLIRAAVEAYNKEFAVEPEKPVKRYAERLDNQYTHGSYSGSMVGDVCEVIGKGSYGNMVKVMTAAGVEEDWCSDWTKFLPEGYVPVVKEPVKRYARRLDNQYTQGSYCGSVVGTVCEITKDTGSGWLEVVTSTGTKERWYTMFYEKLPEGYVPTPKAPSPKADDCSYTIG